MWQRSKQPNVQKPEYNVTERITFVSEEEGQPIHDHDKTS